MVQQQIDILVNVKETGLGTTMSKLNALFANSAAYTQKLQKSYNKLSQTTSSFRNQSDSQRKVMAANDVVAKALGMSTTKLQKNMKEAGLRFTETGKFANISGRMLQKQELGMKRLSGVSGEVTDKGKEASVMFDKLWNKDQANRIQAYALKNKDLLEGMGPSGLGGAMQKMGYYLSEEGHMHKITTDEKVDDNVANQSLIRSTKRFKMELLSVMFFGMAVQRFFGALTKGSLEASGAMDVWSTITMLMGLPVALKLTGVLINLLKWWGGLSPAIQKTISKILYAGMALGALLMIIGTVGLGLNGLKLFFGNLFPVAAAAFSKAITAAGGGLMGFINIVGPLIIGVLAILIGAFRAFSGFLSGNWWKIVSGVLIAIAGIVALVLGGWIPALIALAVTAFVWLGDKVPQVAGIIMAALAPLVIVLTGIYDIIKGIVGLFQGKSFKEAFNFGTVKAFTSQMNSKLKGEKTPETKLAVGGIVTRPTRALIGESGPEAVIPLNGFSRENIINYNPTININANISNSMDIQNIARRINDMLYSELKGVNIR